MKQIKAMSSEILHGSKTLDKFFEDGGGLQNLVKTVVYDISDFTVADLDELSTSKGEYDFAYVNSEDWSDDEYINNVDDVFILIIKNQKEILFKKLVVNNTETYLTKSVGMKIFNIFYPTVKIIGEVAIFRISIAGTPEIGFMGENITFIDDTPITSSFPYKLSAANFEIADIVFGNDIISNDRTFRYIKSLKLKSIVKYDNADEVVAALLQNSSNGTWKYHWGRDGLYFGQYSLPDDTFRADTIGLLQCFDNGRYVPGPGDISCDFTYAIFTIMDTKYAGIWAKERNYENLILNVYSENNNIVISLTSNSDSQLITRYI